MNPTPTADQLRRDAVIAERVAARTAVREDAIAAIRWLREQLTANGWIRYREGEQVSPDGQCVIRTGYAGGETEVQIKRPREYNPTRDITPSTLRLHRGDQREMRLEIEQHLHENTGYEL